MAGWAAHFAHVEQDQPRGLAGVLTIGADSVEGDSCALARGDSIFHGAGLSWQLTEVGSLASGAATFVCSVPDPHRFGITELDSEGGTVSIGEKCPTPTSDRAAASLRLYDIDVVEAARRVAPSARGGREIADINPEGLCCGDLRAFQHAHGTATDSLLHASIRVQTHEQRQQFLVDRPEEVIGGRGVTDSAPLRRLGGDVCND